MVAIKDQQLIGSAGRIMLTDVFYKQDGQPKPLVVYAHGFNGFKDWGNFDLIAGQFAEAGLAFLKFNFSHNGTTPANPQDFDDLEAFGQNNYTKELNDLQAVLNWAQIPGNLPGEEINTNEIYLLGHSRGGAIVLVTAAEDRRIQKVATWASVCECNTPWGNWEQERIANWKKSGCEYYTNSRTRQQMPLYYQLYQDVEINKLRLNLQQAIGSLNIPVLLCHGSNDEAVPVEKVDQLKQWQPHAKVFIVESDHVFGRSHPYKLQELPEAAQAVVDKTITFFLK